MIILPEIVDFSVIGLKLTECLEYVYMSLYTKFHENRLSSFDFISFSILFLILRIRSIFRAKMRKSKIFFMD